MPSHCACTALLPQPTPTNQIPAPRHQTPDIFEHLDPKVSVQSIRLRRSIEYHLYLIQNLILATQAQGYICQRFLLVIVKLQAVLQELAQELNQVHGTEGGDPTLIPLFSKLAMEFQHLNRLGHVLSFCKFKVN